MQISLSMTQSLQMAMELVGGITESVFPQVEALLLSDGDYQKALEYVARRKKMENYWSMIDFLFCELNTEWIFRCRQYYNDAGPPLRDLITPEQLFQYNYQMLVALDIAYKLFNKKRCESWVQFSKIVRDTIKAA